MEQVTQQNAALVKQMMAAARSLKEQAQELVQVVAAFKLNAQDPAHTQVAMRSSGPKEPLFKAPTYTLTLRTAMRPTLSKPAAGPSSGPGASAAVTAGDWETCPRGGAAMRRWFTLPLRCRFAAVVLLLLSGAALAQTRPLLIGAEDDWAPFSSVEKGKPVGMAVEIVGAIFAEAKIPIKIISMPYDRCMKETLAGRLAGCFNTVPDTKRRSQYLFHAVQLFTEESIIVVRKDTAASNLQLRDLKNKKVLVAKGYTYGDAFESDLTIERLGVIGDLNVLRGLNSRQADYGLIFRRAMSHQLRGKGKDMDGAFKSAGVLSVSPLYLTFSRQLPDAANVLRKFNAAHAALLQSNAIADIEKRWE
jgi:polar amino acid transport system substrate-binding protein